MNNIVKSLFLAIVVLNVSYASKLVELTVLDKDYIQLYFKDGETTFKDDGNGACPHDHCEDLANNDYVAFGAELNTAAATTNNSYTITSEEDPTFGLTGLIPTDIYRKTKLAAMTVRSWSVAENDYVYEVGMDHNVYLKLPSSLQQGKTYTIEINGTTNSDQLTYTFTYDIFTMRSEAVKVNVVGYTQSVSVKAADLYMWMGSDGDANGSITRDYSSFVGNKVYVYNVDTQEATEVSSVSFWKSKATESRHGQKVLNSDVWNIDFTDFNTPGTYRLAVEGVGCSDDFVIDNEVYRDPFAISLQGFFYMRIGQDNLNMNPVPRRPLWIPGTSPASTTVYMTSVSPYESSWDAICSGCDRWDVKGGTWESFKRPGNPTNPNAYGGHSDALDWDRHLGHVSIIYDMLLPYIVTNGALSDDDVGIAESGNGIPDLLDEAQNEVDFWLRLRDFDGGYSHGINNPDANNILYQAAGTGVAAWANAANAAMLSNAYQIAGKTTLMEVYRDSAMAAYTFASNLADQQLDKEQNVGFNNMSGLDFKLTAAAFLYNVTGDTKYEDDLSDGSKITNGTSTVNLADVYAIAGYLFTPQLVNYTTLQTNMKASIVAQALSKEVAMSSLRPSRRASDNDIGWMQTEIGVHRSIVAHAVLDEGADRLAIEKALFLEADYSLGRNPQSRIFMTTASTSLENERSVENAFTSGWDDGTPGVHPGHTPYMNPFDWGGLKMGRPQWMTAQCYPNAFTGAQNTGGMNWPMAELYFNTRYVYAHCEFTPQQTMRGKTALYGYLHGMGPSCERPSLGVAQSICGVASLTLNSGLESTGRTFVWKQDGNVIDNETGNTLDVTTPGIYEVESNESGCIKRSKTEILDILPEVNLGTDFTLCNPSTATLDAGVAGSGITYEWELDGELIPDAEEQTYDVVLGGIYTVTISASGCTDKSDEVEVTSLLINVSNDTICGQGTADLKVNDAGEYSWHSGAFTDDLLSPNSTYSPIVAQTTTYYVEDKGGILASVGRDAPGNSTWGAWADSYSQMYKFTVSSAITLNSVKVVAYGSGTVNVHLYTSPTGSAEQSVTTTVGSGETVIDLNFELTPGTYYLNAAGSDADLAMDNEDGDYVAYPYSLDGLISITGIEPAWASSRYLHFYDWVISAGNTCERTPVKAVVLDELDPKCTVNALGNGQSLNVGIYPNPASSTLRLSEIQKYEVYNVVGELMFGGEGDELLIEGLPAGMYLLKTNEGVQQFVKQ